MEESKRQKQVAQLIASELSTVFMREQINIIEGGMVSISKVQITPDLLEARIYLSFYNIQDNVALLKYIVSRTGEWRNAIGQQLRFQLRRIPTLYFYIDDTIDHLFKMDALFKQIENERKQFEQTDNTPSS
ncbi:MAG: 30S ribosome-binding factor RbfA [Chitinophagia bacterium]|nr:30S ribosome-binding factor RbfA [Chitinophagia bacterium]